jgi:hypothetical protein
MACLAMGACKKSSFVDTNINPNTLYQVDPADQFLAAAAGCQDDFEYYYDVLRSENQWMQYATGAGGTPAGALNLTSNFNERYGKVFYSRTGSYLTDVPNMVSKLPASEQPKRANQISIAAIFKAYYAFYVSDINGDIPYTEAFQARYGGTFTPKYDRQQALFDTLDAQIKKAVASLEATDPSTQTAYGAKDPFFVNTLNSADEALAWIKIGNAVRLKIAMRLMKRDPNKLKAIATEVIADSKQMSAFGDGLVLYAGPAYANATGNWNPVGFCAGKPVVDFMKATGDPRLKIYYRPAIKTGTYVGAPTNPDSIASNTYFFLHSDSLASQLQHRLFTPAYDEGDNAGAGTGQAFFPLMTYAEYCFIRAELGQKAITADNAQTWYEAGVKASIQFYNDRAIKAGITGYTPVTAQNITDYLAMPNVAFDNTKALNQIYCQAYLDFFRQPSEAWAWWKRTGFPNTTSVLAWEPTTFNGAAIALPRRASITPLTTSDLNYQNQQAAFSAMQSDGSWGANSNDFHGRVWWEMP